jgi:hypothetical protein
VKQEHKAYKGRLDRKALSVLKVQMERVVRRALLGIRDRKGRSEQQVRRVKLVPLAQMEFRGQPDPWELMERVARKVRRELQDRRDR